MINVEHLPRWVAASINKHFSDRKRGYFCYIEGQDRVDLRQDRFEVRYDGPYIQETSKNYFQVNVEINVLVTTIKDQIDGYKDKKMVGVAAAAFTNEIPVYKFGDTVGVDDSSLVGCLVLKTSGREQIIISNFGLIQPSANIIQSTVEGHYQMTLS